MPEDPVCFASTTQRTPIVRTGLLLIGRAEVARPDRHGSARKQSCQVEWIPATRESAERLGLVMRDAMIAALIRAVEAPPASGVRIVEVPEIRRAQLL